MVLWSLVRKQIRMRKYICDKCLDSFIPEGITEVLFKRMKFDLCGYCYGKLQNLINDWLINKESHAGG